MLYRCFDACVEEDVQTAGSDVKVTMQNKLRAAQFV
jgi:hypothetical protein